MKAINPFFHLLRVFMLQVSAPVLAALLAFLAVFAVKYFVNNPG
jgi:hypothetical protein